MASAAVARGAAARGRARAAAARPVARRARAAASAPATLGAETEWALRFDLAVPTQAPNEDTADATGDDATACVRLRVRFITEEGYEPPQGVVEVVEDEAGCIDTSERMRWSLSEDPNDRKDSLWIWGLFEQPLYPFLLLELTTTGNVALSTGQMLAAGTTLYSQLPHAYGSKSGTVLGEGGVNVRRVTRYQADLAGLSTADVAEDVPVGTCTAVRTDS